MKVDLVYAWVRRGTKGATGLPLNIQVIGKPWQEEKVIGAMKLISSLVEDNFEPLHGVNFK